jgi:DNA-binding CsgD family transcriptional regulator
VVDRAEAELDESNPELTENLELERLATATMSTAALRRLAPLRDRLRDPGETPHSDADRFHLALMALDYAQRGIDAAKVAELAQRAVTGRPPGLGVSATGVYAIGMSAVALSLADRYESALALTTGLLDFSERMGIMAAAVSLLAQRSYIHCRIGSLVEAEADAIRALELGREVRSAPAQHSRAGGTLTIVAVERGEAPDPNLMSAATATESTAARSLAYGRAEHLLAEGRFAAAVTALVAIGEFERELGWEGPAQYPWRTRAALALAHLGQKDRACRLARDELELARAYGAPRPIGVALCATARLDETSDRLDSLREAVALLSSSGARLEQARALVDLGTALRIAGRRVAARKQLEAGYELATQCTSTRLADHAWSELLIAGARPRRKELTGVASLTPSERRIADLAASGSTNREIAQALFVTAKTVETHLGHAYTKLAISSRTELADALGRE